MRKRNKRGSVLVVSLVFALAIATVAASFLSLSLSTLKNADRAFHYNTAFNLAEAGAEEAMWAINNKDWTKAGWIADGANYRLTGSASSPKFTDTQGARGWYSVYVQNAMTQTPTITAEGAVKLARTSQIIRKQVKILTQNNNLFLPPFTAITKMTLNGGEIDSYRMDSNGDGTPDMNYQDAPRRYETTVASPTVSIGNMSIGSPADIYGYVSIGAASSSGFASSINGSIVGPGTSMGDPGVIKAGSNLIDTNRIAYDFTQDFPMPKEPALTNLMGGLPAKTPSSVSGYDQIVIGGTGTKSVPEQYFLSSINVPNKTVLKIIGPVQLIVSGDVDVSGTASIAVDTSSNPDANVELYARGNVKISGNGAVVGMTDDNMDPTRFKVMGTSTTTQSITIGGNGDLAASIYAPKADVVMNGGGSTGYFAGAVVSANITVNGNGYRVRFPEEMLNMGSAGSFKVAKWLELDRASDKMTF